MLSRIPFLTTVTVSLLALSVLPLLAQEATVKSP